MPYYGFLHHDSKKLTDISASAPVGRGSEGEVVELDSMPDYPSRVPLTYDAANRVAIPHEVMIQKLREERRAQLASESSCEWRDMADVTISEIGGEINRELAFPDQVLPELIQSLKSRQLIDMPTEKTLKELVEVAYFASLSPEESTLYPFTIAFLSTDGSPHWLPQNGWAPISFKEPRPFNIDEVTKLAPAIDFSQAAVCVRQGKNNKLEIWGVLITSRSVHKFKEGSQPGLFWTGPRHLRIRVPQPGSLIFEDSFALLLEYRLGEVVTNPMPVFREDGPVFRFLQSFKMPNGGSMPIRYPFALLVQRIMKMNHGGMIILITDDDKGREAIRDLNIKYEQIHDFNYVWSLTERFEHEKMSRELGSVHLGIYDDQLSSFEISQLFSNIEEAIDAYAHLSRVDGSLVLTTSLRLVGFGARINVEMPPTAFQALNAIGDRVREIDLTKFGTRHNSAAAFAQRFRNALVCVCSQDGVVSIFMCRGDKLVLWRPVNPEFAIDV